MPLTQRESEIMAMVKAGFRSKYIANALSLSVRTVECHRYNASLKLKRIKRSKQGRAHARHVVTNQVAA